MKVYAFGTRIALCIWNSRPNPKGDKGKKVNEKHKK